MSQLVLSIPYKDVDLVEVTAQFDFDGWSGAASAYALREELSEFSTKLTGFRESLAGQVALKIGSNDGRGSIELSMFAVDTTGHLAAWVGVSTMEGSINPRPTLVRRAQLELHFVTGALDRFVQEYQQMVRAESGRATLELTRVRHDRV